MEEYSKRTALYGLNPKGVNSLYIESITSYFIRLAEAHVITPGDLLAYEVSPVLKKDYLTNSVNRGGNRFYDGAHFLNGFGKNSRDMVECLSILTGNKYLDGLTLNSLSGIFSTRHLVRRNMAWCPKCLECNDHYPLIWCLSAYSVCTIHSVPLQDKCTACNKIIPFLHRKSRIGICPYCNNFHYASKYIKPLEQDYYISNDLEHLFEYARNGSILRSNTKLQNNLKEIIHKQFGGTINHFAKCVGISKTTMWDWCSGKSRPSLKQVVDISFRLGISSLDLYTDVGVNKIKKIGIEVKNTPIKKKRSKLRISKNDVEVYLSKIVSEKDTYKSIIDIARALNCSTKYLYNNFSEYCKRISFNNRRIKQNKEKERTKEILVLIKDQFMKETVNGQMPSRMAIEKEIQLPCVFINKNFKNYYLELCSNYGSHKGKE
ncbi:helix-turn-helix domain-containing protein [Peribacillus frigoritolerans]|uniref:helix-turn-helix domain-containing protein n=1 Tax=Peribacillus frigoritolerans TaxID=450367 RepID=UPI00207A8387|nr:helix-turn-helix domain-containing protein [Peribacillus frigoritolerans]USK74790.1 helix-turn-helix domain-containing protein [Peribacillus frigoritolerans]